MSGPRGLRHLECRACAAVAGSTTERRGCFTARGDPGRGPGPGSLWKSRVTAGQGGPTRSDGKGTQKRFGHLRRRLWCRRSLGFSDQVSLDLRLGNGSVSTNHVPHQDWATYLVILVGAHGRACLSPLPPSTATSLVQNTWKTASLTPAGSHSCPLPPPPQHLLERRQTLTCF